MDENKDGASSASQNRAGIASQLSPLTRSSLSECSSLTQRIRELERALGDAIDTLKMMDCEGKRADAIRAPEDAAIRRLCETLGYGAVMDAAARQWFKMDRIGSFVVGPCAATVRNTLARCEAVLRVSDEHAKRENAQRSSPEGMPARPSDSEGRP